MLEDDFSVLIGVVVVQIETEKSPFMLEEVPFPALALGLDAVTDEFVTGSEPVTGVPVSGQDEMTEEVLTVPVG
jgi:hypothetical protein